MRRSCSGTCASCQGRWLAIGILTANLVGDSVNALLRHDPKTLIGLPIGGLMIWYLVKKKVSAEK